jgi:hypothetical protein
LTFVPIFGSEPCFCKSVLLSEFKSAAKYADKPQLAKEIMKPLVDKRLPLQRQYGHLKKLLFA